MPTDDEATAAAFALAKKGDLQAVINSIASSPALVRATDVNGWTLLHVFARLSLAPAVKQLLARRGAGGARRDVRSALHLAARADALVPGAPRDGDAVGRRVGTLTALLAGGARVTARDSFGLTALHHAAQAGHTAAVELLLSLRTNRELHMPRAPLEAETNAEERAIHLAAAGGHADTVKSLLEHNAHPGHTNYLGQTALHLAVLGGDAPRALATVKLLVGREWRVDVNAKAADGGTPLHAAAAHGHARVVKALLAAPNTERRGGHRSTKLDAVDGRGRTPHAAAKAEGFDDVAEIIDAARLKAEAAEARRPAEEAAALAPRWARCACGGGGGGGGGFGGGGGGGGFGVGGGLPPMPEEAAAEDAEATTTRTRMRWSRAIMTTSSLIAPPLRVDVLRLPRVDPVHAARVSGHHRAHLELDRLRPPARAWVRRRRTQGHEALREPCSMRGATQVIHVTDVRGPWWPSSSRSLALLSAPPHEHPSSHVTSALPILSS